MFGLRERLRSLRADLDAEFGAALAERYTPRQVAGSFALGVFITALPTFGVGLLAFLVLVWLFEGISKLALFASVLVLNPVVKWGVYGTSFGLGSHLLGPIEGVSRSELSLSAGPDIVIRLLVGNLILAVVFTVIAYVVAYRLTAAYVRRNGELDSLTPFE
jgi:uncharacterized protein (DUF2062 family)